MEPCLKWNKIMLTAKIILVHFRRGSMLTRFNFFHDYSVSVTCHVVCNSHCLKFVIDIMSFGKVGMCQICNVELASNLKSLLPRSANNSCCTVADPGFWKADYGSEVEPNGAKERGLWRRLGAKQPRKRGGLGRIPRGCQFFITGTWQPTLPPILHTVSKICKIVNMGMQYFSCALNLDLYKLWCEEA